MSNIFISYKREEQATARKLANALETEGWTVWWDPKLRAGERFNDVIEKALKESRCVVVMWSKLSVESKFVKDEATYALNRNKLVPVMIEEVELPFRFEGLHTASLLGWDGSKDFSQFRRLVEDIATIVGQRAPKGKRKARGQRTAEKERLREKERKWSDEGARPKADEALEKLLKFRESAIPKPGVVFRDKLKDGSQGPEMVVIPAGTFRMGDINGDGDMEERPVHLVRIIKPFAIGRYAVTFEEYDQFAVTTGRGMPGDEGWGRGERPVINVSWYDAVDYRRWLSAQTDKHYRLPSEAEWEYAARAGTETKYWWGTEIKSGMANYHVGDIRWGGKQTSPVGSFQANPFGLYDTAGNVWEWVQDDWHESYQSAPNNGSAWKSFQSLRGDRRVLRGGSWASDPETLRVSFRTRFLADTRFFYIGFRIAQDIG
jgi:formylglycine-generating enzyme required for sulfatase activity